MMIFLNALLCQWILSRLGKCSIFISSSDPQSALKSTNFELPFLPFGCLSVTNSKHDMTCPSPFLNSNRYSDIFNQSICSFLVPPMLYSAFFPHFSLCIKLFSKYFKAPSFTYFKNKYIHLILLFYIFLWGSLYQMFILHTTYMHSSLMSTISLLINICDCTKQLSNINFLFFIFIFKHIFWITFYSSEECVNHNDDNDGYMNTENTQILACQDTHNIPILDKHIQIRKWCPIWHIFRHRCAVFSLVKGRWLIIDVNDGDGDFHLCLCISWTHCQTPLCLISLKREQWTSFFILMYTYGWEDDTWRA